jgi:hypothetical protein
MWWRLWRWEEVVAVVVSSVVGGVKETVRGEPC